MKVVELVSIWQKVRSVILTALAVVVFYLILFFTFPGWSEMASKSVIKVMLRPKVVISGDWIRLGDIAEVSDDSFSSLVLMPAPEEGDMLRIDPIDLRQLLARRGVSADVEGEALVVRGQSLLRGDSLKRRLSSMLAQNGYVLEQKVLPNIVGSGEIEIFYPSVCGSVCYARVKVGENGFLIRIRPKVKGKAWRLKKSLLPGQVISQVDVELIDCSDIREGLFPVHLSPIGWTVKHPLKEGQLLLEKDVAQRCVIRRGDKVKIVYQGHGIKIKTVGISLQNGLPGKVIRVKNATSGKEILAKVVGPGVVEVEL